MPELPEVESIRRSLQPHVIGRTVRAVAIRRADVIHGTATPAALLLGRRITMLQRHGKELAMLGARGAGQPQVVLVHLGMTGSLRWLVPGRSDTDLDRHVHVVWHMDNGARLVFRDPRRFGGIWPFDDLAALWRQRWERLGPDALGVSVAVLCQRLANRRKALKSALLDQRVLAGLGNIYVDELLGACRLHPLRPCGSLATRQVARLAAASQRLLEQAIRSGGSTVRDHCDAHGCPGHFQGTHHFYGRSDQPCRRCGCPLSSTMVAGRTTVFCSSCQRSAPPFRV